MTFRCSCGRPWGRSPCSVAIITAVAVRFTAKGWPCTRTLAGGESRRCRRNPESRKAGRWCLPDSLSGQDSVPRVRRGSRGDCRPRYHRGARLRRVPGMSAGGIGWRRFRSDPDNDLRFPDGSGYDRAERLPAMAPPTPYASAWRVDPVKSLFAYGSGETRDVFGIRISLTNDRLSCRRNRGTGHPQVPRRWIARWYVHFSAQLCGGRRDHGGRHVRVQSFQLIANAPNDVPRELTGADGGTPPTVAPPMTAPHFYAVDLSPVDRRRPAPRRRLAERAPDGRSVGLQTTNGDPTFFVSPENDYVDTTFRGSFRVDTTSDDDFIGFVLGYRPRPAEADPPNAFDFVLFDWKRNSQTYMSRATIAGFRLARVQGTFASPLVDLWASGTGHQRAGRRRRRRQGVEGRRRSPDSRRPTKPTTSGSRSMASRSLTSPDCSTRPLRLLQCLARGCAVITKISSPPSALEALGARQPLRRLMLRR